MIVMLAKRCGLDGRFYAFVVVTMLWTMVLGIAFLSTIAVLREGEGASGIVFFTALFGVVIGGVFGAIAFIIWIVPSAIVFSLIFNFLRQSHRETSSAIAAAIATVAVACISLWLVQFLILQDKDSIFMLIILLAPISLIVAPVVAWRLYRTPGGLRSTNAV